MTEKIKENKIEEDIKKIKESVKDIIDVDKIEDLLKNNEVEFDFNEIKYKIKKPSFKQKQETNQNRIVKYTELLKAVDEKGEAKYLMEKDLILLYKKRGIDIHKLNKDYDDLDKQINGYMFKLGKAIKDKKSEAELKIFHNEIEKLNEKKEIMAMEKTVLLDTSIQSQIYVYSYTYLTYLVLEKLEKEKWVKAFNNYDDFINQDERLVNMSVYYLSLLSKNELPEV